MHKTREALWSDYDYVSGQIKSLTVEDEKYEMMLRERDNIRNQLLKLEQIESEKKINDSQIETDLRKDTIRNVISVFTFGVSTIVSICSIAKTFKFDQNSSVTSTLGRNILNGVIPKGNRR